MPYFVNAHKGGDVISRAYIGKMHYDGCGIPRDYDKALFWFETAAMYGNAEAQRMVGLMYYEGKVSGFPDYRQAVEWLCKSANNGDSLSYNTMGITYFKGNGKTDDYKAALN